MSILSRAASGKYLAGSDMPGDWQHNGVVLTIEDITEANMAREGQTPERKPILSFKEPGFKPMAVNKTNAKFMIALFKTENEVRIIGRKIGIFRDPTVTNQSGNVVGGLKLMYPKVPDAPEDDPALAVPAAEDDDATAERKRAIAESDPSDDIPF